MKDVWVGEAEGQEQALYRCKRKSNRKWKSSWEMNGLQRWKRRTGTRTSSLEMSELEELQQEDKNNSFEDFKGLISNQTPWNGRVIFWMWSFVVYPDPQWVLYLQICKTWSATKVDSALRVENVWKRPVQLVDKSRFSMSFGVRERVSERVSDCSRAFKRSEQRGVSEWVSCQNSTCQFHCLSTQSAMRRT